MLSIMARSKRKGYLLDGEKRMESKMIAKKARLLSGDSEKDVNILIEELENHDVFSRNSEGIIYNRRMAREAELSRIRSAAGKMGGRPSKSKTKAKDKAKPKQHVKAPSASASASIFFNSSSLKWEEITEDDLNYWKSAYPACDIKAELARMGAWLMADWPARRKVKWKAFIVRWLAKSQDQGGTKKGKQSIWEWAAEEDAKEKQGK